MSKSYIEELQQRLREAKQLERQLRFVIDTLVAAGHVSQDRIDQANEIARAALAQPQVRDTQAGADTIGQLLSDAANALAQPQQQETK